MTVDTDNQNTVTEEEKEARLNELSSKTDATEDEKKELSDLKEAKQTGYQKRIDTLTWKAKSAEEREAEKEEELIKLRAEVEAGKITAEKSTPVPVTKTTLDIGGEKYYTDEALQSMIDNREISQTEANKHYQQRMESSASEKAYQRLKSEQLNMQNDNIRKDDAQSVLKEFPQFSKDNPNFNPSDPLYKTAMELYNEGYATNPRGLSLAVNRAKQIHGLDKKSPDISADLSVDGSDSAPEKKSKDKALPLTEQEKEGAIRMFTKGDLVNPTTGLPYTENEAIAKAQKAKDNRPQSRRMT